MNCTAVCVDARLEGFYDTAVRFYDSDTSCKTAYYFRKHTLAPHLSSSGRYISVLERMFPLLAPRASRASAAFMSPSGMGGVKYPPVWWCGGKHT